MNNQVIQDGLIKGMSEWVRDDLGEMIENQTGATIRHRLTEIHPNASGSTSLILHLDDRRVITISISVEK
jgi:type III secretory pathway component EscT